MNEKNNDDEKGKAVAKQNQRPNVLKTPHKSPSSVSEEAYSFLCLVNQMPNSRLVLSFYA